MKLFDIFLLILLAAIWGSSFIFMRFLAPILGPFSTATGRTLIAGIFLLGIFIPLRVKMEWRKNLPRYIFIGVLNSGLPFLLYSFAALRLPASIPAIINALTPLWGAIFAALILGEALTGRKLLGLLIGIGGVALIALRGTGLNAIPDPLGIAACVLATICYGIAGTFIKRWASDIPARTMTAASLTIAGLVLLPLAASFPPAAPVPLGIWIITAVFALLCSAFAFLIYFRLIASAGVTAALSVTLLVPAFAFLWGFIFLGETISIFAVIGAALVLSGTILVTNSRKFRSA